MARSSEICFCLPNLHVGCPILRALCEGWERGCMMHAAPDLILRNLWVQAASYPPLPKTRGAPSAVANPDKMKGRAPQREQLDECPFPTLAGARDQHAVVHGYIAPCICAPCWAYSVRVGIEPISAAPALPSRLCPAAGLCSPHVAPTTYSSYSSNTVSQSASWILVSSSRYCLARSSALRWVAATLTVLTNLTSERVARD